MATEAKGWRIAPMDLDGWRIHKLLAKLVRCSRSLPRDDLAGPTRRTMRSRTEPNLRRQLSDVFRLFAVRCAERQASPGVARQVPMAARGSLPVGGGASPAAAEEEHGASESERG